MVNKVFSWVVLATDNWLFSGGVVLESEFLIFKKKKQCLVNDHVFPRRRESLGVVWGTGREIKRTIRLRDGHMSRDRVEQ